MNHIAALLVAGALAATACGGAAPVAAPPTSDGSPPVAFGSRSSLPTAEPVPDDAPDVPSRQFEPLPTRERPEILPASVLFETGRAVLRPAADRTLAELADRVTHQAPDATVVVTGHTDSRGDEDENLLLSEARARAVADWLVAAGWDPARVVTRGAGESQLLVHDVDGDGTFIETAGRRNRRVEISVVPARD